MPAVFNNLGAAYLATGNKEKAISSFKKALAIAPEEEAARFNLGQVVPSPEPVDPPPVPVLGSNEQGQNDTILHANVFEIGQAVDAEVSSTKDQDYFKFRYKTPLRDKITVTMENRSTTLRPWVKVYNKNKSEILNRYDETNGANLEFNLSVEPDPDYYLRVLPYDTSGKYRLSVVPEQAFDRHELTMSRSPLPIWRLDRLSRQISWTPRIRTGIDLLGLTLKKSP